jgi:hypothetical protein
VAIRAEAGCRFRHALREQLLRGIADVRRQAGERLVEHARQGIHVAAPVECPVARLLGTHVRGRAGDRSRLRDGIGRAVDRPRDPEIRHHRVSVGEEDVLGLDVAMHDPARMGIGKRTGDLPADV